MTVGTKEERKKTGDLHVLKYLVRPSVGCAPLRPLKRCFSHGQIFRQGGALTGQGHPYDHVNACLKSCHPPDPHRRSLLLCTLKRVSTLLPLSVRYRNPACVHLIGYHLRALVR